VVTGCTETALDVHFQRGGVSDYYILNTAGNIARRYARVCVRSFCPRLSVCVYIACVYTAAKAQARQRIRKSRVAFLYVTTQANVSIFRWRRRCYRHRRFTFGEPVILLLLLSQCCTGPRWSFSPRVLVTVVKDYGHPFCQW